MIEVRYKMIEGLDNRSEVMIISGVQINGLSSFDTISGGPKTLILKAIDGVIDGFAKDGISVCSAGSSIFITKGSGQLEGVGGITIKASEVRGALSKIMELADFSKMTLGYGREDNLVAIVLHGGTEETIDGAK